MFLAKFYGRAGLLNLLNAGPDHLRPAIFQSLLYEACGRVVDPVYGSVGLLHSGQWHNCQVAVDAVLKGLPIMQLSNTSQQQIIVPPLKLYDIRHMSKDSLLTTVPDFHQKVPTRPRLRRRPRPAADVDRLSSNGDEIEGNHSHDNRSMFSIETTTEEGSMAAVGDPIRQTSGQTGESEMGLELTLGFSYDKYGEMRY